MGEYLGCSRPTSNVYIRYWWATSGPWTPPPLFASILSIYHRKQCSIYKCLLLIKIINTFAWIRLFSKNICIKQSGDICLQSWCGSKRSKAVPFRVNFNKIPSIMPVCLHIETYWYWGIAVLFSSLKVNTCNDPALLLIWIQKQKRYFLLLSKTN